MIGFYLDWCEEALVGFQEAVHALREVEAQLQIVVRIGAVALDDAEQKLAEDPLVYFGFAQNVDHHKEHEGCELHLVRMAANPFKPISQSIA